MAGAGAAPPLVAGEPPEPVVRTPIPGPNSQAQLKQLSKITVSQLNILE